MDAFLLVSLALCAISFLLQSATFSDAYVFGPRIENRRQRKFYMPLDDDQQLQEQPFGFQNLWSFAPFNRKDTDDTIGAKFASGFGKIESPSVAPPLQAAGQMSDQQTAAPVTSSSEASTIESKFLSKWARFLRKEQQQQDAIAAAALTSTTATTVAPSPSSSQADDADRLPVLRRLAHDNVRITPLERNVYQVQEGRRARPVRVELGEVEEQDDLPSLSL